MKTPLQQLKEKVETDLFFIQNSESELEKGCRLGYKMVLSEIESLLPIERECIINAREDGHLYTEAEYEGCGEVSKRLAITSEQYFNETYNENNTPMV